MTLESTSARAVLSSLLPTARFVRIGIRIGPYVVSQISALLVWVLTPVFNAIFGLLGALFIVLICFALLGGPLESGFRSGPGTARAVMPAAAIIVALPNPVDCYARVSGGAHAGRLFL